MGKTVLKQMTRRDERMIILSPRLVAPMAVLFICLSSLLPACGGKPVEVVDDDILVELGDTCLRLSEVERRIPSGLTPRDSAALFERIVGNWVEEMVISEMARDRLGDLSDIDSKVEDYRRRLIVSRYISQMRRNYVPSQGDDSIRSFYNSHRGEMLAETPLVKGLLVKAPLHLSSLPEIRRCLSAGDDEAIDELESEWISDALQYEYFAGTWVDWQRIAEQIPYRFHDADEFVASLPMFETTSGGSIYLLRILDCLPSGSELPYEFAAPRIRAMLDQKGTMRHERELIGDLISEALKKGRLKGVGYDASSQKITLKKIHLPE